MLNSKLFALVTAAVLTFGLTACAPDKKTDTWTVDAPQISLRQDSKVGFVDGSDAQSMNRDWNPSFKEMSQRILPVQSEVVFPSLEKADSTTSPYTMTVTSTCSFGSLKTTQEKVFPNTGRFSLLAILPDHLLVTTFSSATHYDCQIDFLVSNQYGSTYDFALPQVNIGLLDSAEKLSLATFAQKAELATNQTIDVKDAHEFVVADQNMNTATQVTLVCDAFSNTKTYSDLAEFHLNDLLPTEKTAWWKKACRLQFTEVAHPAEVKISNLFEIHRAVVPLQIQRVAVPCSAVMQTKLGIFQVTNLGSQPQIYRIKLPTAANLSTMAPAKTLTAAIDLDFGKLAQVSVATGEHWLQIAPGETQTLTVEVDGFSGNFCGPMASRYDFATTPTLEMSGRFGSLDEIQPGMAVATENSTTLMPYLAGIKRQSLVNISPNSGVVMSDGGSATY